MPRFGLYQPFIEDRNVQRLYRLKVSFSEREGRRVPMTVLVNRILDDFFEGAGRVPPGEPLFLKHPDRTIVQGTAVGL